ncbi:uncharacterized protein EKO05_0004140 [Ascochyta rabiei]|uniref:uncharacterized protein n=1 Tax=Didymella rabiei TaxID=5454 RepID=UPI0021FB80FB|nr:uncharacterized protein EKO05_0004140 [Ascochyta rabiei]UPX13640.1 hypothetical protein EKO05_0004140 [Ascochyta rabiei]
MRSAIVGLVMAGLSAQVLSSPLEQATTLFSTPTPAPTCTLPILKQPSFKKICTKYGKTLTFTSYTNCGGCSLETKHLGFGLPCQTVTYNPGNTAEIVTSCKPSLTTTKRSTFHVRPTVTSRL